MAYYYRLMVHPKITQLFDFILYATLNLLFMKKISISLLTLLFFIVTFYSCKKNQNDDVIITDTNKTMQPVIDAFKEKYKTGSFSETRILNLPGKGFWADNNGVQVTRASRALEKSTRNYSTTMLSACPDPGEDYPSQSIYSVLRELTCEQGYRIEVKYDLILAYTPQLTNSSLVPSFGRVWLFNSAGAKIWPTITPTPKHNVTSIVSVGSAGTDPNGLPLTKYRITFKTDYIPEAIFDMSSSMQSYLFTYTDCPEYPTVVCPFSTQQSAITSQQNAFPCERIDKVYWNPSSGIGASVAGVNTLSNSCYPFGYVFPQKHEIEIYRNSSWESIQLWRWKATIPPPPADPKEYSSHYMTNFDSWYIRMAGYESGGTGTISDGYYQIRYRNRQDFGSGGPCSTQPAGTWVIETWYLSI